MGSPRPKEHAFFLTRDQLAAALASDNIDTRRYFNPPLHQQTVYTAPGKVGAGPLPVTDRLARELLTLPLHLGMSPAVVRRICETLVRVHEQRVQVGAALKQIEDMRS